MSNYFIDILEITLPISALILILTAFSPLIKRGLVAKWRYYMWLFIAVRMALPFKLFVKKAAIEVASVIYRSGAANSVAVGGGVNIQRLLTVIYFTGVLLFFFVQLLCYIDFAARVRRWEREPQYAVLKSLESIKREEGIKRKVRAVICKSVGTPMMTGLIRPKLILPDREFNKAELAVIIKHEIIHMRNHDILYKLIIMLANGLHWFNPAVYLMAYMANRDVELVCDGEVVRGTDIEFRQRYCKTILRVVHNRIALTPPLSTGFAISKQIIRERIEDILSFKLKKNGVMLFTITALSVAAAGSVIGFAKESIRQDVEESYSLLERVTPAPRVSATPTAAPVYTPNEAKAIYSKPVQPAKQAAKEAEKAKQNTASWWSEDMTVSKEALDKERGEENSSIRNISAGATASLEKRFSENEDVTMGSTYYVEPNRSMKIYHKGGVVQAADATTGELVYDSSGDEADGGVISAGNYGAYYRINISQSEENEENAQVYIIEE